LIVTQVEKYENDLAKHPSFDPSTSFLRLLRAQDERVKAVCPELVEGSKEGL